MSWETKLTEMKGRTFRFQGQDCHVLNYEQDADKVTILTNLDDYDMPSSEVEEFLAGFEPLPPAPARPAARHAAKPGALVLASPTALGQMQEVLLSALDRVQTYPSYVPQAREISCLVQTGINLAKVELAAIALTKGQ